MWLGLFVQGEVGKGTQKVRAVNSKQKGKNWKGQKRRERGESLVSTREPVETRRLLHVEAGMSTVHDFLFEDVAGSFPKPEGRT